MDLNNPHKTATLQRPSPCLLSLDAGSSPHLEHDPGLCYRYDMQGAPSSSSTLAKFEEMVEVAKKFAMKLKITMYL